MKKIRFVSLLLVMLLLSGCGKVSAAEKAIAAIGTVTIESRECIEEAEAIIAGMSINQQQKVVNLSVLNQARDEYDRLEAAVDKANDAILAIGTVTLSSSNAIRLAQEAYDALAEDGLTDYVASNYPILVAAKEEFDYLCAKEIYNQALAYYEQGNYSESMTTLRSLDEQYPDSSFSYYSTALNIKCIIGVAEDLYAQKKYDEAFDLVDPAITSNPQATELSTLKQLGANCIVASATELYNHGNLEDALSKLKDDVQNYSAYMNAAGSNKLQDKIKSDLEAMRPLNGKVIVKNSQIIGGYGQFTVQADSTSDALIKLESTSDPSVYILFYVRAGEEATISVRNGEYKIKYTSGPHWFGKDSMFGKHASYTQADQTAEFTVEHRGSYVYYSVISITLYKVIGGNMNTSPITSDAF